MGEPKVIYQDSDVMVVDKPPGWVVNDAKTAHGNPILQNWLSKNHKYELSKNEGFRSGIVHRLDKDTSGMVIIAKNEKVFYALQLQFKERKIKKTYFALVHGIPKEKEGVILAPLGRLPWNRERFGVVPSGKNAETFYKVIGVYRKDLDDKYCLLELNPKTGRTHQIRVHLKHIGHPIVSDNFYAGRKTSRKDRIWCERLFLHAGNIEFIHPISKKIISINSQIPKDLKDALDHLQPL